jgi:hypothetical protein
MPLTGRGMLITSMDVDPADEPEFNAWYDREHLAERVAIEGFLEARRWLAVDASPKYFCTYSTESFETLTSPAYARALASQTERSRANIARFRNMGRVLGRVTASRGQGRGAALGVVRLRPAAASRDLRERMGTLLDPGTLEGIISLHLVEADAGLSKSLTEPDKADPGAGDWYVLIDGTDIAPIASLIHTRFAAPGAPVVSTGTYRLMWDLGKAEL